jgi:TRAP-type transport system small permease protein
MVNPSADVDIEVTASDQLTAREWRSGVVWLDWLIRILIIISGIAFIIVMLGTAIDVIMRYIFNKPITGGLEMAEYLFVTMVFLAIAYTQSKDEHIRVDFIVDLFPIKGKYWSRVLSLSIALIISLLIAWRGLIALITSIRVDEFAMGQIPFPLWPSKLMVPLGFFVLSLRLIFDIVQNIKKARATKVKIDGGDI